MEPKIRLKGFSGEWLETTFDSLAKIRRGLTYSPSNIIAKGIRVLRSSNINEDTFITSEDDVFVEEECVNIPLANDGDILITAANGSPRLVGKHAVIKNNGSKMVPGGFMVLAMTDEPYFLNSCMSSPWYKKFLKIGVAGGNGAIGNLNKTALCDSVLFIPTNRVERDSIASYFQHLDSLIQSTTKKIESLKQVKVASLQSMFPQEGETTPRVRFKGFEGEWENKTLGECLTINNERNQSNLYGINDVLSVSDEVGVVNQIKLLGRSYAGKSVANYRVLKTNQIVYTKSPLKSKPYGIVKVNKGAIGIVSVLYAVYDANENVYPDYIHYYFEPTHRINNYLLPLINKGAKNTMNISDEMALTGHVWIPSFEEQKKIAIYLQVLDNQIILQTQRLEKLKQIKSACLDNMFV